MLDPEQLYRIEPDAPQLDQPVLITALDGFVDAGNAARLAVAALLDGQDPIPVVRFDADQLVDYRSRRPPLRFETNRWAAYAEPRLEIVALEDTAGRPYLLLTGPEPDLQWERFCAAVCQVVERLGVRLVINMTGIPMAVPHTRPIGVTVHATRPELTEGHETWFATAEVPGSAVALLEYRLGESGHDAMGFAVHVPHYLARTDYPQAARVLLDHVGLAAELYLPTEELTSAAKRADVEIAAQVQASDEVAQIVAALERQYDTATAGRRLRSGAGLGGELPSAEELAAEVERFLASQNDTDDSTTDNDSGDTPEPRGPSTG